MCGEGTPFSRIYVHSSSQANCYHRWECGAPFSSAYDERLYATLGDADAKTVRLPPTVFEQTLRLLLAVDVSGGDIVREGVVKKFFTELLAIDTNGTSTTFGLKPSEHFGSNLHAVLSFVECHDAQTTPDRTEWATIFDGLAARSYFAQSAWPDDMTMEERRG